ncbi:MAG: DUF4404 family protein [Gammaproteobacteria bacterium]|nr:DUF4404 family protein [Gammaproteobacteria bacterium]
MPDTELRKLLAELNDEIDSLEPDNENAKQKLGQLVQDLEQRLDNPDDASDHDGVVANVQDTIRQLEVEHPRATGILNNIMMTLSNMGI